MGRHPVEANDVMQGPPPGLLYAPCASLPLLAVSAVFATVLGLGVSGFASVCLWHPHAWASLSVSAI